MSVARSGQTATLLKNGKVLVTGGSASAELYDPVTRSFSPTGSMSVARSQATATPLPNGEVLVAGGCCTSGGQGLNSAELYNPATGTWTLTGSLNHARYGHTATLLPDGQVLVAGGACNGSGYGCKDANFSNQASAELYGPATGTWRPTGSMNQGSYGITMTLLLTGKVLVTGGVAPGVGGAPASAELYDPATGTWNLTGSLTTARFGQTATLMPDGAVMVAGGCTGGCEHSPALSSTEFFHETYGYWSPGPPMTSPRYHHTATLLGDGDLLIVGGDTESCCEATGTTELYTPAAITVKPASGPPGQAITITGINFFAGSRSRRSSTSPACTGRRRRTRRAASRCTRRSRRARRRGRTA